MTQHRAKLFHGPFDGTIRSLPADITLDADPEEKGNPQLVIRYERVIEGGEKIVFGMYLRLHKPNADGVWEYLWVEREEEVGTDGIPIVSEVP